MLTATVDVLNVRQRVSTWMEGVEGSSDYSCCVDNTSSNPRVCNPTPHQPNNKPPSFGYSTVMSVCNLNSRWYSLHTWSLQI
ncbi:hypothetical protein J6590_028940 [Homalodisca vitripennis]|nr:hypothetical protein J6590_028940 [Homalodisca vitripennis]